MRPLGAFILAWLAPLAGCTFDPAGASPGVTAGRPDAAGSSPSCPGAPRIRLAIDGAPVSLDEAPVERHVIVGDTVQLSAAGSCAGTGPLAFLWRATPLDGIEHTIAPDVSVHTISLYPAAARRYTISLVVSDTAGTVRELDVLVLNTRTWRAGGPEQIRGLAEDGENLWIAAESGAYRLPLATPETAPVRVTGEVTPLDDEPLKDNLADVYAERGTRTVWFGRGKKDDGLWRVRYGDGAAFSAWLSIEDALGDDARVEDIGPGRAGTAIATSEGLTWEIGGAIQGTFDPKDGYVAAVAAGGGRAWAAGEHLYDLDADGEPLSVFSGDRDERIRALAVDEDRAALWLASDGNGVARVSNEDGAVLDVYPGDGEHGLTAAEVHDLALERDGPFAGDVWAATSDGVARFKRDRQVWVLLRPPGPDYARVSTVAVVYRHGIRTIYAGSSGGLMFLEDSPELRR